MGVHWLPTKPVARRWLAPRRYAITALDTVLHVVVDHPARRRFVIEQDGEVAELEYEAFDDRLVLVHTEVPSPLAGRGIGGSLVEAAVDRARREGLAVEPRCRFARGWLRRHPQVIAGLTVNWTARGA